LYIVPKKQDETEQRFVGKLFSAFLDIFYSAAASTKHSNNQSLTCRPNAVM
jgi:hypothetical protein